MLPLCFVFVFSVLQAGCTSHPRGLLSQKSFAAVLAEMMITEKLPLKEKDKTVLIRKALAAHHVSPAQFRQTKLYYKNDVDFWLGVYRKVEKIIADKQAEYQKKISRTVPPDQRHSPAKQGSFVPINNSFRNKHKKQPRSRRPLPLSRHP